MSNAITGIDDDLKANGGHFGKMLDELESVKDNPRLVLVLACAFAEDMVNELCKAKLSNYKKAFKSLGFLPKASVLNEVGLITDGRLETLNWIRLKRNKVAHSASYTLTKGEMPSWADDEHKTPEMTFSLCIQVIGCFWNENDDVFKPIYLQCG